MRGIFTTLASLTTTLAMGCAVGSEGVPDENAPVVALSDPSYVPPPSTPPANLARVTKGREFSGDRPLTLTMGCRKDAFCDDFEDATPGARWTSSTATAGAVDFVGPSSSAGVHALRATTTGTGGAAAYLTLAGPAVGQQWVGSLAFSLRVDALPTTVLGGPEIVVVDANGASTRVGFSVRPDGIALHQYFEACSGPSCTTRSDLVADVKAGEWRRLTVGIETAGNATTAYGRIEVTVDGGELITLPLVVAPFDGKAEVHAGITVADTALATARIDDVVFFTH